MGTLVASTADLLFQQNDVAFREEVNQIRSVIAEYQREEAEREILHKILFSGDRVSKINQLLDESSKPGERQSGFYRLPNQIDFDYVRSNLRAQYWQKVVDMTNVLQLMPANRREQWRSQFIEGKMTLDNPLEHGKRRVTGDYVGVPEFSEQTVVPTLLGLLNDRNMYLNERVYNVFSVLSPKHKTNKSYGFSEKLIVADVVSQFWGNSVWLNTYREDNIDDLRMTLRFFAHGRFGRVQSLKDVLSKVYTDGNVGKWASIDGNVMRVKMFKNGNLHIEIHPDVAWRLNEVLAASLPYAIPSEFRSVPNSRSAVKDFGEIIHILDEDMISLIANTYIDKKTDKYKCLDNNWNRHKASHKEYNSIMQKLGGVFDPDGKSWSFNYDFDCVRGYIVENRSMPDQKSYQFYPTPETIQVYVSDLITLQDDETLLEPSAGRGDLISPINQPEQTTCIELSPLFCQILKSKGYESINEDFLKWSSNNEGVYFDKIAMNPPYSEGRAKVHVKAAISHLKSGGRCVAVVPGSERMDWVDKSLYSVEDCATFSNEFEDTGVTVKVFTIDKRRKL
ncbi:DUF4942 domain-containing protein [Moellerella wisconsensis]|uniref:DUF4942 domain-containing protein n=1 Tax=Moellerella wisconsensis TaxID=158849 RepID=A0ACD3YCW7_9GAMM|nr:DUF4942 domain-containing protein [Moellerella wisconsensis]UNH40978.1 DUF4942 domain-containing protein [Moellerella wisconsensis]